MNEMGIRQAEDLAEKICEISFQGIVYSPLLRARQTAEIIFEKVKREWSNAEKRIWKKENVLLMEQDYGCANGRFITFSDEEWETWYATYGQGGESDQQFEARIHQAAKSLLQYGEECILVVSHGAVVSKLAKMFTGQEYPISGIGNGTIICVETEGYVCEKLKDKERQT